LRVEFLPGHVHEVRAVRYFGFPCPPSEEMPLSVDFFHAFAPVRSPLTLTLPPLDFFCTASPPRRLLFSGLSFKHPPGKSSPPQLRFPWLLLPIPGSCHYSLLLVAPLPIQKSLFPSFLVVEIFPTLIPFCWLWQGATSAAIFSLIEISVLRDIT